MKAGVIASRIAAHAADIARGQKQALKQDEQMARARKALDWEQQIALALDSEKIKKSRKQHNQEEKDVCTMCGQYCALKVAEAALAGEV